MNIKLGEFIVVNRGSVDNLLTPIQDGGSKRWNYIFCSMQYHILLEKLSVIDENGSLDGLERSNQKKQENKIYLRKRRPSVPDSLTVNSSVFLESGEPVIISRTILDVLGRKRFTVQKSI